ncbi:pyridine nucleotide-disulfide oxidoreductase family protein [Mycobacterium avium subsp. avium 2285 (R)]|nr:pyridine nucleotide-disulfide oxidoreductase family protein [Mycobacterium avium subsp. avium 2285 (R)]
MKQYAADVADKYDVRRHMRFNTTVEGAQWDEDAEVWRVALAGGESLTTRFLITATGFLSQPHTPDIPGIGSFGERSCTPRRGTTTTATRAGASRSSAPGRQPCRSSRSWPRRPRS